MKTQNTAVLFFVLLTGLLHVGLIRKSEDPILKTQTDPILYKEKMEQETIKV